MPPKSADDPNCTIAELSRDDAQFLNDRIVEFNSSKVPFTQSEPFINIAYGLRDGNGILLGGIAAVLYCWRCLCIDVLWVSEAHQGKGYGSRLLRAVEDEAKRMGCVLAHLDTFDFQAREFYMKHGYESFGELDDCPPGHKRFYLRKSI